MSYINFQPWVGKDYEAGLFNGKKVLILGESHYCEKERGETGRCNLCCAQDLMTDDCFNQTVQVIDEIKNQDWRSRTFSNFERTIFGKVPSQDERIFFWDRVVFYNYLQFSQSGPTRPLEQSINDFKVSELAFKELLEMYMPDYIIAWGIRLYKISPDWDGEQSTIEVEENGSANVWTYTINDKRIPALFIHHPSHRAYSWPFWHPFVKQFLGLDGTDDIPTWLAHKPIIAVNYKERDEEVGAGDADYLSLGRSTWDEDTISAKIWRKSSGSWSRQSEDIPLWRLLDMAILLVATYKEKPSILGEKLVNESDKGFLKEILEQSKCEIQPRIEELARLLK